MDAPSSCPECGTELAPALLACPACRRLVHRERLEELARQADEAELRGERDAALLAWRAAHGLLPPDSAQFRGVAERVARLLRAGAREPQKPAPAGGAAGRWLGSLGAVGVAGFSLVASFGVYWAAWGWTLAAAFLAAMYVHELGHVVALRRLGIPASAPMFVPGLGAYVRFAAYPTTPREDAQVGLAGPLWGLGAAVAALAAGLWLPSPFWRAVAELAGILNLFNLAPVWQLDGARGFHPLSRGERLAACASLGVAWRASGNGLVGLVALVALVRALLDPAPGQGDRRTLLEFVLITLALAGVVSLARP